MDHLSLREKSVRSSKCLSSRLGKSRRSGNTGREGGREGGREEGVVRKGSDLCVCAEVG